jgi:hypothetical protein
MRRLAPVPRLEQGHSGPTGKRAARWRGALRGRRGADAAAPSKRRSSRRLSTGGMGPEADDGSGRRAGAAGYQKQPWAASGAASEFIRHPPARRPRLLPQEGGPRRTTPPVGAPEDNRLQATARTFSLGFKDYGPSRLWNILRGCSEAGLQGLAPRTAGTGLRKASVSDAQNTGRKTHTYRITGASWGPSTLLGTGDA